MLGAEDLRGDQRFKKAVARSSEQPAEFTNFFKRLFSAAQTKLVSSGKAPYSKRCRPSARRYGLMAVGMPYPWPDITGASQRTSG
jgi:hypothetical protein